jgi:peptide-methionine (R)-S-oxide reductase
MAAEDPKKTTLEEWAQRLDPEAFRVTRQAGTERPFTGKYWDTFEDGSYHCICCDALLFEADAKFSAHCGWPSFDRSVEGAIEYVRDDTHGMARTEVRCGACEAHLGHVFPDGPTDTGTRYCINSVSIDRVD